jgi:phage shock protein PspC (stress-responsive transcriptional regulator)
MNKVFSVNIGGQVFTVDELAFEKLRNYLDSIKSHFRGTEGSDEIIADIESRIAEMLRERLKAGKDVTNMEDVDFIMLTMGRPEEFEGEANTEETASTSGFDSGQYSSQRQSRRLFRDPDNKVLGGVCSGVSAYFGINDPVWMRLFFVIIFFTFGSGLLLYIILWVVIPKAKTITDRMEMRGENVTINNIKKTFDDEYEDIKTRYHNFTASARGGKWDSGFHRFIQFLESLLHLAAKVFVKIIGVVMLIAGIAFLMMLMFGAFGAVSAFSDFPLLVGHDGGHTWLLSGLLLVLGIPVFIIVVKGIQLLFNFRIRSRAAGITLLALWIAGCGLLLFRTMHFAQHFADSSSVRKEFVLDNKVKDTLLLSLDKDIKGYSKLKNFHININDDDEYLLSNDENFMIRNVSLKVKSSPDSQFHMTEIFSARGASTKESQANANSITYTFRQMDNKMILPAYCSFPKSNGWKNQKVKLILEVPQGKVIYFDENMQHFLNDVSNTTDTYDEDMLTRHWKMTAEGLKCLDCPAEEPHKSKRRHSKHIKIDTDDNDDDNNYSINI